MTEPLLFFKKIAFNPEVSRVVNLSFIYLKNIKLEPFHLGRVAMLARQNTFTCLSIDSVVPRLGVHLLRLTKKKLQEHVSFNIKVHI